MKNITSVSFYCFIILLFIACKSKTQSAETSSSYLHKIELSDLATLQEKEGVVLIDVRTQSEVDEGSIPGMLHLDYNGDNFAEEISKLEKDTEYIVYCQSGIRSAKACKLMKEQGFTKLNDLIGGYNAYKKAGN